jgi:hypothetical protein
VPKGGILALDPTASGAITASGQGNVNVKGGTVIDDSNNAGTNGAMTVSGGGTMTADAFNITGLYKGSVGSPGISTTPTTGVPPTPDPYFYITAPTPPAAGTITKTALGGGSFKYELTPGSFGGSGQPKIPNFSQGDQVIFDQSPSGNGAIYYLTSGGLTSNGADLTMGSGSGGIMFYNAGTSTNDKINIAGSPTGTVNLSGINTTSSSSNYIYQGLLFFQARNAGEDVQITGNGNFTMEGTFYAPDATLKLTGQGALSIIGSNLVADQISITGQGSIIVDYSGFTQPRGRFLGLVE